jgi:7-cyano-7-deazaguanine synthase
MKKAVVLLSGGLDSATTLYLARARGYDVYALIFHYGQRHGKEVRRALAIARRLDCPAQVLKIGLPWRGSALLDRSKPLPQGGKTAHGIPSTYVPARNTIFLSFALSYAESIGARHIFIGARPGLFRISGLPAAVLPGLAGVGKACDQKRSGGRVHQDRDTALAHEKIANH